MGEIVPFPQNQPSDKPDYSVLATPPNEQLTRRLKAFQNFLGEIFHTEGEVVIDHTNSRFVFLPSDELPPK